MEHFERPNGLKIDKVRVPLGVIGIIYEARPNVTADAFGLCFKTGNAVILKGGSDAIHSNIAIVRVLQDALDVCKMPRTAVQLIEDTDRAVTAQFMKMRICGCTDSQRWCGTDPQRGGEQYDPRDRNRHR